MNQVGIAGIIWLLFSGRRPIDCAPPSGKHDISVIQYRIVKDLTERPRVPHECGRGQNDGDCDKN